MEKKAFQFDECGKQFSPSYNLKKHKFIHTAEKAFECDECGKQFAQHARLKQHKCIHIHQKKINLFKV